jgi:methylglutaconyl-CoA hydratase
LSDAHEANAEARLGVSVDARGVATVALARPAKHNAMDAAMIEALAARFAALGEDASVRAIVLTGQGASFCAGADLGWMKEQMAADAPARAAAARALADMLGAVDACPKPVVGRVQGQAFGGGLGLVSVCDVAIGVETARFGLTETRLGLIPATIGPYVVARMGGARARRVFMSARVFDAAEAVELGLLARAVPEGGLDAAVEAEIAPYLACAPGAVAEAKTLARALGGAPGRAEVDASIAALVRRWESAEAEAGIAAFFARRAPEWSVG